MNENVDVEISFFNFNSTHHDKCKFVLKFIRFLIISNFFPLEVGQISQMQKVTMGIFAICMILNNLPVFCTVTSHSPFTAGKLRKVVLVVTLTYRI